MSSSILSTADVNFGSPVVFFDSHPEEQDSYLYSYWSSLKASLKIAWTGNVPKFHEPGILRIIFWTYEGTQGFKDYELRQYETVRDDWQRLLDLDDVRRALVMGYSGQNPYVPGHNPWVEKFTREKKNAEREQLARSRQEQKLAERKGITTGHLIDIQDVIKKTDDAEWQSRVDAQGKISQQDRFFDV